MAELETLEAAYLNHHIAQSSSTKTLEHYLNTFILFHHFLEDQSDPHSQKALTGPVIPEFVA